MTSSTPTSKPEQQTPAVAAPVEPKPQKPWWRRWVEPILAVTIIAALLTDLVTGGSVAFQSLKGDIHASEARVSARIDRLVVRIGTVEAGLHEEIQASEARRNQRIDEVKAEIKDVRAEIRDVKTELKQDNGERKADMRAMDNKLDRVLEALPAASPVVG